MRCLGLVEASSRPAPPPQPQDIFWRAEGISPPAGLQPEPRGAHTQHFWPESEEARLHSGVAHPQRWQGTSVVISKIITKHHYPRPNLERRWPVNKQAHSVWKWNSEMRISERWFDPNTQLVFASCFLN